MAIARAFLVVAVIVVVGCRRDADVEVQAEPPEEAPRTGGRVGPPIAALPATLRPGETMEARIFAVAERYRSYQQIQALPRWAPMPCGNPFGPPIGELHQGAGDEAAHGQKLYYLFASKAADYTASPHADPPPPDRAPVGQTVVKQAFRAVEAGVDHEQRKALPVDQARSGGKIYRTGDHVGLFVMTKLDPTTPDTDAGWIYGVVAPDEHTVTAAGNLELCRACHVNAERDRLFGFDR
jgi:hypothetical protein